MYFYACFKNMVIGWPCSFYMDQSSQTKISLFKTLFRGREDIFAQRWEKGGKAGYSNK